MRHLVRNGASAYGEPHQSSTSPIHRRSSLTPSIPSTADDSPDSSSLAKQRVSRILEHLAVPPTDDDYRVTYCELFSAVVSILGRIVGILINLNVAYEYLLHGKRNYFMWTVACFVIPMIVTTFVQIAM